MSVTVTWIMSDAREITAQVAEGTSLMEAAIANGVPIAAECGGACACATCHVVVLTDADLPVPSIIEEDMLDFVETGRQPGSRLSCQVRVSARDDGLRLLVP